MELTEIEIVEDRTAASRCDEGFLRLRRLQVRNHYADGSHSQPYPCDIVTRPSADAVAICLYERDERSVRVLLKDGPRVPIYLRRFDDLVIPDARPYSSIVELVAGLIEDGDHGPRGLEERAALEAEEEAGVAVPLDRVVRLGDGTFASPGISDEKVYYAAADITGLERGAATGDGSVMEEAGRVVVIDLGEAIRRCRSGEIPDMKTEVGLLRLADRLGYVPQLGCFVDELPAPWRERFDALGAR